jgi:hypothetical protein
LPSLDHESLLQVLAEISVAFVGFSMLASVFRTNEGDDRVRFAGFRDVAETGLLATIGSLAPVVLHALGWPEASTWRVASGGLAALWAVGATASLRRNPRQAVLLYRSRVRPVRHGIVHLVTIAVALLGAYNALVPSPSSGGRHVLLVCLCLIQSAQLFLFAGFEEIGSGTPPGGDAGGG